MDALRRRRHARGVRGVLVVLSCLAGWGACAGAALADLRPYAGEWAVSIDACDPTGFGNFKIEARRLAVRDRACRLRAAEVDGAGVTSGWFVCTDKGVAEPFAWEGSINLIDENRLVVFMEGAGVDILYRCPYTQALRVPGPARSASHGIGD